MRKPHRSSTVLPGCTDHSYLTGRLQRTVWGDIRGRLETQTEHCHSFVSGLQLCFQQAEPTAPLETTQDRKSDGQKLLPDSQQAAPLLEQQEEHKFHTSLFQNMQTYLETLSKEWGQPPAPTSPLHSLPSSF